MCGGSIRVHHFWVRPCFSSSAAATADAAFCAEAAEAAVAVAAAIRDKWEEEVVGVAVSTATVASS